MVSFSLEIDLNGNSLIAVNERLGESNNGLVMTDKLTNTID